MEGSGLSPPPLFHLGPIEVTRTILDSLIVSGVLIALAVLVRLGLGRRPSGWPVAAELMVEHFEDLMQELALEAHRDIAQFRGHFEGEFIG